MVYISSFSVCYMSYRNSALSPSCSLKISFSVNRNIEHRDKVTQLVLKTWSYNFLEFGPFLC